MLLILFLHILIAYNLNCNDRTPVYKNHGRNNYGGYYFIKESYVNSDVCKKLNDSEYMLFFDETFNCTWIHCLNNSYNVEHIIPIHNNIPEIFDCDINISGNLIMAYDTWIRELNNTFFYERLLIYNEIYINAYQAVYWCCKQKLSTKIPALNCLPTLPPLTIPTEFPTSSVSTDWTIYLFIALVLIICAIGLYDVFYR